MKAARRLWLLCGLVVPAAAADVFAAPADKLSKHPSRPDAAAVRALAKYKGNLYLQRPRALDVDVARALATSRSSMLVLGSLAELDPDVARAFGEYEGQLHLPQEVVADFVAMHPLSPENARGIASLSNGVLKFVTALDSPDCVDIAKALAARKGRLALPNLEKISPKALTALIAKEDVEIPAIETLEFIREPDGSPTDDFVIPERFEARPRPKRGEADR